MTSTVMSWGVRPAKSEAWCTPRTVNEPPEGSEYAVERNPAIWNGFAVIRGTRIPVFMVEDLHDEGLSAEEITGVYARLTPAEVYTALAYAWAYSGLVAQDRDAHSCAVERAIHG